MDASRSFSNLDDYTKHRFCFLCGVPRPYWSVVFIFEETICRCCLNFEGPEQLAAIIQNARFLKSCVSDKRRLNIEVPNKHVPATEVRSRRSNMTTTCMPVPSDENHAAQNSWTSLILPGPDGLPRLTSPPPYRRRDPRSRSRFRNREESGDATSHTQTPDATQTGNDHEFRLNM